MSGGFNVHDHRKPEDVPVVKEKKAKDEKSQWPMVVFLLGGMIIIGAFCLGWRVTG